MVKAGLSPRKCLDTTVAVTAERTMEEICLGPYSLKITSRAKNIPAKGALKVAATPLAAPQATRIFTFSSESLNNCPKDDPKAETGAQSYPDRKEQQKGSFGGLKIEIQFF